MNNASASTVEWCLISGKSVRNFVVCSPQMKPGATIGLRPSMVKFDSQSRHLEVCTFAMPLVFSLNRQIIMALRTLGISDEVFVDMYHSIVERLDAIRDGGGEALDVCLPFLFLCTACPVQYYPLLCNRHPCPKQSATTVDRGTRRKRGVVSCLYTRQALACSLCLA
jgi:hypothetical protein